MTQDTNVSNLIINKLKQAQYNSASRNANEFYITTDTNNMYLGDLQVADTIGEERLHALKAYSDNGELLTDAEGLADVTNYAHSTFDLSKFTVVGSPNITDDGIASGLNGDNYLIINNSTLGNSLHNANSWKIIQEFTYNGGQDWATFMNCTNSLGITCFIIPFENNMFGYTLSSNGTDEDIATPWTFSINGLVIGNRYKAVLEFTGTQYINTLYNSDGTQFGKTTITSSTKVINATNYYIGKQLNLNSPIDLKQFSITVDGVEVFSGNKTGIDTIKPDDYTVVGTPTISADGVISNITTSDYTQSNSIDFSTAKTWAIETIVNINSIGVNQRFFSSAGGGNNIIVQMQPTGELTMYLSNATTGDIANGVGLNYTASLYERIKVKLAFTGTAYEFYVNNTKTYTLNSNTKIPVNLPIIMFSGFTYAPMQGNQDLNAFKIYVDGDLVYQPCLKIPYTLSKTGSKIVNAIYRNRVNDMAEQFGHANYYTLNENKANNYTVVGTPTISADGIASGFSDSNYLTAGTYDLTNAKTFKFNFRYKLGTSSWSCICGFGTALYFERMGENSVRLSWWENGTGYQLQSLTNIPQNVYCDYEIEITSSNVLYCRWKPSNDNTWAQEESLDVSSIRNIGTSLTLYIGKYGAGLADTTGSIDLNAFKIYVDGKLAYRAIQPPCFTLPQGELYGLMNKLIADKGGSSSRNVGEIIPSSLPLTDAGLHLLDGSLILGGGIYSEFVDYIADLYGDGTNIPSYFCTESEWQTSVTTYGVCGKFVYDSTNNTVRLPKYNSKIYTGGGSAPVVGNGMTLGLTNGSANVGLAQSGYSGIDYARLYGNTSHYGVSISSTGYTSTGGDSDGLYGVTSDPTKSGIVAQLSDITTSLEGYYYIVIANSTKTDIQVDIDEIATDLNGKADVDLSNVAASKGILIESYVNGASWYRVYSDGWCEQGGWVDSGVASVNAGISVTFLKSYKDNNYTITFLSSHDDTSTNNLAVQYGNLYYGCYYDSAKTKDGIKICGQGTWQACGYII